MLCFPVVHCTFAKANHDVSFVGHLLPLLWVLTNNNIITTPIPRASVHKTEPIRNSQATMPLGLDHGLHAVCGDPGRCEAFVASVSQLTGGGEADGSLFLSGDGLPASSVVHLVAWRGSF